jgi:hypothetical protein
MAARKSNAADGAPPSSGPNLAARMASRQQLLTHLNLRRRLESQEGTFCSGFYQNLANYGGDNSAGFEWLIALMRNQNWDT